MIMSRVWAMPNSETFKVKPIGEFVERYLRGISIDPFARDCNLATYTNDLNTETAADYHMHSLDFLAEMESRGIQADTVLFDPPYSLRQAKEVYEGMGRQFTQDDSQQVVRWGREKEIISRLVKPGGYVLSFGWNSGGQGKKLGFAIEEVLLVAHGGAHNDTICVAERKL